MKQTSKRRIFGVLLSLMLVAVTLVALTVSVSADDLQWNLLTDTEAGYRIHDSYNVWEQKTDADGTVYMENKDSRSGALYIYDDQNILGSYLTFSLEGDFYFESFPHGERSNGATPKTSPVSFLCWVYNDTKTMGARTFNALRIDDEGYIYTGYGADSKTDVKLEAGVWMNVRCVFTPKNGFSEMFINGEKVLDFSIKRYDPETDYSGSVRYFDGYYNYDVKMKNLIVKTDSDYTIVQKREESADFLGYQTAKPEGGTFDARMVLGVNDTVHNRVGYEALVLTRDEDGLVQSETLSLKAKEIYETLTDAAGNTYNIKELYGYNYAAALELSDLPLEPAGDYFELVLRPYVLGMDGIRRYGLATTMLYTGETDAEGYPILERPSDERFSVLPTDDTSINGAQKTVDNGSLTSLPIRNTGSESSSFFRAAYFKFTLDEEAIQKLETAAAVKLRICVTGHENNASRKQYDMILQAVGTDWDEHSLNYSNYQTLAPTYETIYQGPYELGAYFTVDILPYLQEQLMYNDSEDGSLTVAFRLFNEGFSDTIVAFVGTKESNSAPVIEFETSMYYPILNLSKIINKGYEPWGYAEYLVDEWFDEIVDKVYLTDENGDPLYHEVDETAPEGYNATVPTGDFTREIAWNYAAPWSTNASEGYVTPVSKWKQNRFARTLSTLGTSVGAAFLETELADMISKYDVYGGIANAGFTGTATGFFHTEVIDGRTYIIDPLGNPYFALGMNTVDLGHTQNQKDYTIANYGLEEVYYDRISKELKATGVNLVHAGPEMLKVKDGLPTVVGVSVVLPYMISIGTGRTNTSNGFANNDTMNVFDPDFVKFANETYAKEVEKNGYADNPFLFGYTSDNELASGNDILLRYLTLDPKEPTAGFSYAVAWTWLARRLDNPCPTIDALYEAEDYAQINDEFLSFVYGRYYRVTREAIEAVDPNHMYIGSRINGTLYTCEPYHRVAGHYLDIITANLYGGLNPEYETIIGFYRNAGIPFMVTEFFAKGADSIDANGYPLANSTGAGHVVQTQQDRADFYEHYALILLESKACVGWSWYCFRDNDQTVVTTDGSNRFIMLNMTYGSTPHPNTLMNVDTGEILTAAQVGEYRTVYEGGGMHSNQNINKGIYNGDFSSTVTVYEYDKDGTLVSSKGYELADHPESREVEEGTALEAKNGNLYTIGTAETADGGYTETILTVYKGQYVAFANAIRNISDHLIGIINYFDAE